jgi:hypothetical protein
MKNKGFENGNVVPIVSGNVQSFWIEMPNEYRKRDRIYPILRTGMHDSAMQTYLEAECRRKKEKAARIFGGLADKLRAKRDGV